MRFALLSLTFLLSLVVGAACATQKNACDADPDCKTCPPPGTSKHRGAGASHGGGTHGGGVHGGAACPMMGGASPTAVPEGVNAVQNEMRLLNHAFHKSMTAAALGDVSIIPGLFHEVHQARGLTDKALADGTWKPAKGDLAEFKAMDGAFHGELEKLVHAAQANDVTAVVDQLDRLLPSCVACHTAYREPGLPPGMKPAQPVKAEHPEHPKH